MQSEVRFSFNPNGIQFWVQAQPEFRPEVVRITPAYGSIEPGPRDTTIRVTDARNKVSYKDDRTFAYRAWPPYHGKTYPPVRPRADGHFIGTKPGTREFLSTAAFASARCALEIWKHHLGVKDLPWHFEKEYGKVLQIFPRVRSRNSWMGRGFMEFGFDPPENTGGDPRPLAANFDAVAHETGHLIIKSLLGNPSHDARSPQHRAHEEACADLVAAIAALHFDSVLEEALTRTRGRLAGDSAFSLLTEWGEKRAQRVDARSLFNTNTLEPFRKFEDPSPDVYALSLVFSGGVFDGFVSAFYRNLVSARLLEPAIEERARTLLLQRLTKKRVSATADQHVARAFASAYKAAPERYQEALRVTRDRFARLMARTWHKMPGESVTFASALTSLLQADRELSEELRCEGHGTFLRACFAARGVVTSD